MKIPQPSATERRAHKTPNHRGNFIKQDQNQMSQLFKVKSLISNSSKEKTTETMETFNNPLFKLDLETKQNNEPESLDWSSTESPD